MAKRTKKPRAGNGVTIWQPEEEVHLLAWLDHCIKYLGKERFNTTAAAYMSTTTQRILTPEQCKRKVAWLWNTYGREESKISQIWSEGSSCFNLLETERLQIQQICDGLEGSSFRARLRSSSRRPEYELSHRSRESCETSPLTSLGSAASTLRKSGVQPRSKGRNKYRDNGAIFPGLKRRRSPSKPPDLTLEVPNTDASSIESEEEDSKTTLNSKRSNFSPCGISQRSVGVQHDDELLLSHDLAPPVAEVEKQTRLVAEKEARIKEQQYEIFRLENSLSATRSHYENLLRRLENPNDSLHNPESLYKLQNGNSVLNKLLTNIQKSQPNALHVRADALGPTASAIRDDLYWLEGDIAIASTTLGCSTSTIEPLSETPIRLRELIARVSGMSVQQFNTHMVATNISGRNLFRSLAAALVCELAFEPPFPEPLDVGSLLLHEYREQVLMKGDQSTLESLDILAHRSLFSNPYFVSRVIPEKARDLATEVYQLLAQWNCHGTKSQSLDLGLEGPKEDLFQPVFTKALTTKVQLLLSKSYYTFVFPAPGTTFDPITMRRHTPSHDDYAPWSQSYPDESSVRPKEEEESVKLCLLPALYAYRKQADEELPHSQKTDIKRHVMNYRNFFVNDDGLTAGEPVIISKAMVLI
ncbi:hypothetical protein GGR53DRAFT_130665 [Hypoxylon sp. FL1150]|nr:hypothetical protein GGR53DRAFT_130665 [Hypoxylon sp. FL1150]